MTVKIRPEKIRLEASSFCQLRCPSCPTTRKAIHPAVGSGFLKASDFRKLVDDNPRISEIELSNFGEIFLNPELLEIMAYAHSHGVILSAGNGVNLNNVKDDVLEGLVKYGFRRMSCSIDGASAEIYSQYRVRGSFDRVLENIRKINGFKELYKSTHPILNWSFIVFRHNEHEILDAKRMAEELNMTFSTKLAWDDEFSSKFSSIQNKELNKKLSSIQNKENVKKATGRNVTTREEFRRKHGHDYMQGACKALWTQPQINWDGKVLGCCINFWGDFGGNAFTDGLVNSVNNEKIAYARDMLLGKRPARDGVPCTTCKIYLGMKASGWFFKLDAKPLETADASMRNDRYR